MAIGLFKADPLDEVDGVSASPEFEKLVRRQLELLGEDPQREGLDRTPARVAKALQFLTQGYNTTAEEVVGNGVFKEEHDNMIMVRDIELYSLCEHHMLPFFGKAHVAYIPNGKIVGLSKIPRIVDVYAPPAAGPGEIDRANRRGIVPGSAAEWCRCSDRGLSPVHDDARRGETELEDDYIGTARSLPRGSENAR